MALVDLDEAALGEVNLRFSARDTKNKLRTFLRGVPSHFVPTEAEVPLDLGVRVAKARVGLGVHAGKEPDSWEQELDEDALRRAEITDRASNEEHARMPELFQWVPWFEELAAMVEKKLRSAP